MKAKRSTRKREHLLNNKSENYSVLGNAKWSVSYPKEICWGPTIYCSTQNKRKLKAKVRTLQEKYIVHEAIKYSVLKGDLIFTDEERVPRGYPQALTLVPLGYFLG
jgi:hypothetical protein